MKKGVQDFTCTPFYLERVTIMKILFVGDIMGRPGRELVHEELTRIRSELDIDFVIINGENASGGRGITLDKADGFFQAGCDVITMGNHVWDQRELVSTIDREPRIVRPINYPPGTPGKGSFLYEGTKFNVGVINAQGRVFMQDLDCPFRTIEREVERLKRETNIIIVDFHAEATSEKQALGWFLDGQVTAVLGTHTHIQTSDARILPGGTGYVTDAGMTGPRNSILGMDRKGVINKFTSQMPARFVVADGERQWNSVVLTVSPEDGTCSEIAYYNFFK